MPGISLRDGPRQNFEPAELTTVELGVRDVAASSIKMLILA
jgi:hypothetical protein